MTHSLSSRAPVRAQAHEDTDAVGSSSDAVGSSSEPVSPPAEASEVVASFNAKNGWSVGERLRFGVLWGEFPDNLCRAHTFDWKGHTRAAYYSECPDWEVKGDDVLFFIASLENRTNEAIRFNLRDFILISRDGRSFGPINVRSIAKQPSRFLPERGIIPPHGKLSGLLTFDGRVLGMVADRVSYVDDDQTLTQVIHGTHHIVEPA